MRVFNLTSRDLHFRKTILSSNGGYKDFPELDDFVPDSDKGLAEAKVISFGSLPKWWLDKKKAEAELKEPPVVSSKTSDTPVVQVESEKPKPSFKNKRK